MSLSTTDEWRGEEDEMEYALRIKYDQHGNTVCSKWFIEELLKKAGLYKYEENIYGKEEG